jgi:outer membrane assembly lipoprotein YfiO
VRIRNRTDPGRISGRPGRRREARFPGLAAGICVCLLALGPLGCGSTSRYAGLGAEGDYLRGQELYDKGRCVDAADALQRFLSEHPGSARVDDAIFYLGLSRKCLGDYVLARDEFERLMREFPQSDHREEAEWERALCFYETRHSADRDPEPTDLSIEALRNYLNHYPDGQHAAEAQEKLRDCLERLALKAYENGRTYEKLGEPFAAVIYFEKSLDVLGDSRVAGQAMTALVRDHAKLEEPAKVYEWYQKLQAYATPERIAADPKLKDLLSEAEKYTTLSGGSR